MMMRFPNGRKAISAWVVGLSLYCSGEIPAAEVYVNSSHVHDFVSLSVASQVDYRLSNNNFDMRLNNGGPVATAANNITLGLGNVAFLNNRTYDFSLEFRAGTVGVNRGFIWRLSNPGSNGTLAWGVFDPVVPPPSTVAASINSVTPIASFNAITIAQRAQVTAGTGSYMTLSDLNFASPLTVDGSWINSTVTTPGGGPAAPILTQVLASTVDLSTIDWTLTGKVTAFKDTTGGDESVSLTIAVRNASFTIAPEPSSIVLGFIAAAFVASASKRHGRNESQPRFWARLLR